MPASPREDPGVTKYSSSSATSLTPEILGASNMMEDVLMRGRYIGMRRFGGIRCGVVEVDWVYNSMPPVPGRIYPPVGLEAVREF
jgi:hypothetical protein